MLPALIFSFALPFCPGIPAHAADESVSLDPAAMDPEHKHPQRRGPGTSRPTDTVLQMQKDREAGLRTPNSAPPYGPRKTEEKDPREARPSDGARADARLEEKREARPPYGAKKTTEKARR